MLSMSAELARQLLDAAPDAMILVDAAGVIRFANRQSSVLFGAPLDAIVGREIDRLLSGPLQAGGELCVRRADGSELPVDISLSPIDGAAGSLIAAVLRDAGARRHTENELAVARQSAARAIQSKSRFLAMASHDLRQPLQALTLVSGILRRVSKEPQITDLIAQQDLAVGSMSRLLKMLLDISRLESGAIQPELTEFTVASLFDGLRREFAPLAQSRGLEFETQIDAQHVRSDRSLLEQVLRNLLSNAFKYTRQGWVQLRSRAQGGQIVIEVADTGSGIAAEHLPHIFDEFYQAGVPVSGVRDGHGLGLSIVQRLVALLEIELDVRSQVGHGSVFSLTLPAVAGVVAAPERTAERAERAARPTQHILLIEDDPAVRSATRMLLQVEGYAVIAVSSLAEARRHLEDKRIDALISDFHLGEGATGAEAIAALRQQRGVMLPGVLITGDTAAALRDLPRDARLRVTSKPVNADELLALLRELLTAGE